MLARLAALRQAPIDQRRAPRKPHLLLWLFGQFAATGSSAATGLPVPRQEAGLTTTVRLSTERA